MILTQIHSQTVSLLTLGSGTTSPGSNAVPTKIAPRVYKAGMEDGIVYMTGETYYPDNEDLEGRAFTAAAKPYKYNGKNTWYILSLDSE